MSLKILESHEAYIEAVNIALYIADTSYLEYGHRFLEATRAAYKRLADMPGIGAPRDYGRPDLKGMRMWPVPGFPNHLIFYRASETELEILHVLHGAQDIERFFTQ